MNDINENDQKESEAPLNSQTTGVITTTATQHRNYTVITLFYSSESKPDANTEKQESNPLTNRPRADAMDGTYSTEHKTPNDSASATYATPNTPPEAEPTPG